MTKNKHPGKGFFRNYLAVIAWAAVVMILCGIPGNDIPDLSFINWLQPDKFVHLFMFGILNFMLIIAFARQFKSSEPATGRPETIHPSSATPRVTRLKLYATILTILYGILTEVLQATVFIGRTGDVRDAAADALGAACGILLFNLSAKRYKSLA